MKKKKFLVYLCSFLLPIFIFLVCAAFNKYIPFGSEILNAYDSFTQYPGMLLEYARLLRGGNIFYSWGAGLGFNFFGTITYYGMSPLNLLSLFASPENYHMFIALMTFLRFGLLGVTMCFYLNHKNLKPCYIVMFSTIYALMGYTATYYYNYIWIDSVIMLPIIIYGLDKLIEGKSPALYIFSLAFTIIINYYIGYMICIFSLVWFIYKMVTIDDRKKLIKTFIISSLLAGLMSAIVLLPSMFALLSGKAVLYNSTSYFGINRNSLSFLYTFTTGSFQAGDQSYGPGLVYSSIMVFALSIFYFFNKKFSKKEKIATLAVILFFYLSLSVNCLNYAWHLFLRPIWWQSRFSFLFSFFLIDLGVKTITNIKDTEFKTKYRVTILGILIVGMIVGALVKFQVANVTIQGYTYFFLGFSILILIEMMFLLDKKEFMVMLMIFTFAEVTLNTFNSLKNNYRYNSYTDYEYIKEEVPKIVEKLDKENDEFYRMEFMDDYTSNDGLYFGFNGFNYFNSARNIKVVNLMSNLGLKVSDQCHIILSELDPFILSLFNIKYLYGLEADYYEKVMNRVYENKYPLGIGFMVSENIKDLELNALNGSDNRDAVLKALMGNDEKYYKKVNIDEFKETKEKFTTYYEYDFKSDGHYMMMLTDDGSTIEINGKEDMMSTSREIKKGDRVKIKYSITNELEKENVTVNLLDLAAYEKAASILGANVLHARENVNGHILEGTIDVTGDFNYLFTSIEYEDGMKVYVDGDEVKIDLVLGALIGLNLEKGSHKIVIDYVPKGFKIGASISTVSLLTSIVYLQIRKKSL